MSFRLINDLHSQACDRPDSPAFVAVGVPGIGPVTYGALCERVTSLSRKLRSALPAGSIILVCYPNGPDFVVAFLSVLAAGHTAFALPAEATPNEIAYAFESSRCAAGLVDPDAAARFESFFPKHECLAETISFFTAPCHEPACGSAPALLLLSSGTTGLPKIVRRDLRSLAAMAHAVARTCGFGPDDNVLAAAPLYHSYGIEHGLLGPIAGGSCVRLLRRFDLASALAELQSGVTLLPGVPFMFDMLCRAAHDVPFPALRRAYSAGGPLTRATFDAFQRKFGIRIGQVYGATEVGSVTFADPDDPLSAPPAVGRPLPGVSLRILDVDDPCLDRPLPAGVEGQIAISAPSMFSGYLGEAAPLVCGHYLTGDLGTLDVRGALTLTGRLKLLIDVGGRKVNPAEVESVLRQHPQVEQCVVIPLRLSEGVHRLKAVVTPARRTDPLPADLRRFARERLSGHKVPRIFEVRAALPLSPAGKVLRHLVETT